ncbi:MAG: amidohydrolase family protein [Planctomycetes bacterium]|nr:amidohydrolase family protein [Planctomycetota bacterium]
MHDHTPSVPCGRSDRAGHVLTFLIALCTAVPGFASTSVTAIKNVAVIDVDAGVLRRHQTVLVEGDRITRVGPSGSITVPHDATVVDGDGLFLVPGLIDAHVHYMNPQTFGPMMIAHGVTLVRDTGGATESVLAMREQLRTGEMLGPEMLCTGAIIDGDPPVWPFSEVCRNADEARAAVRKLAKAGVDQIKVYSKLSKDAYVAAVAEAHQLGLKAIGHVPLSVTLSEAIDAGQDGIEHLDGFDELIATAAGEDVPDPRSSRNKFARWDLYARADQSQLQAAYRRIRDAGITICPTIVVMKGISQAAKPDESNPWLEYVPPFMRTMWSGGRYPRMASGARRVVPLMQSVILDLHKAGVNLICGTDLSNPYVFAGHSLHDEMQLFQAAGIPTKDVLRSATIRSAEFLGVADRLGSIAEGKIASMFLTKRNPLEDVRNANDIAGVFLRGRFFDRKQLDDLLAKARRYAKGTRDNTPQKVDMSLAGQVIRRGTYRSTFNNMDAGKEDFIITKTDDGFSLKAHSQPRGGFQQPSFVTVYYDAQRRVREASWQQLTESKLSATYTFGEKAVVAKAQMGESELPPQQMDLPEHWLFTGPFTALEFAHDRHAPKAVNETKSFDALGFGFAGWKLAVSKYTVTRKEDRTLKSSTGKEIKTRFYTSELQVPMGTFTGETWTDLTGVVLKSTLTMPFGTVTVTLD